MAEVRSPMIVVGVDGTPASEAALEFAMREAKHRGSAVDVVTVWDWSGPFEGLTGHATADEARQWAQRTQDLAVGGVLARVEAPPVVSRQVLQGEAAATLLIAARHADYLVVGSAHKDPLRRALLGSVSEQCVRRAICPVVVVPVAAAAVSSPEPERIDA